MNRWLAILPLLALLGFAAIGVVNLTQSEDERPGFSDGVTREDGRTAPERDFETLIGAELSYNFSTPPGDKPIAVNLFASWCAPCAIEHPLLLELEKAHPDQIYGLLYEDTPEKGRAFLERLGNPYKAVGMDTDGQGGLDFGLTGVPETFVISPAGKIILHIRGPLDAETLGQVSALLSE